MFITLEGPEGSGKSTQLKWLTEWLPTQGVDFVVTREPGGTPIGDQVRQILMGMQNGAMAAETEFLLFSASRAQLVREVIRPALDAGKLVLCDRFYDSSLAYQGYGRELDLAVLKTITTFATDDLVPDVTFLLDVDVEQGLLRRRRAMHREGAEWNRLDAQTVAFHQRVREGYQTLAVIEPERWVLVDAGREAEVVQAELRGRLQKLLA